MENGGRLATASDDWMRTSTGLYIENDYDRGFEARGVELSLEMWFGLIFGPEFRWRMITTLELNTLIRVSMLPKACLM